MLRLLFSVIFFDRSRGLHNAHDLACHAPRRLPFVRGLDFFSACHFITRRSVNAWVVDEYPRVL